MTLKTGCVKSRSIKNQTQQKRITLKKAEIEQQHLRNYQMNKSVKFQRQINSNGVPSHYTHAFTEQQILDIIHIMKAKETSENQITKQLLSHF